MLLVNGLQKNGRIIPRGCGNGWRARHGEGRRAARGIRVGCWESSPFPSSAGRTLIRRSGFTLILGNLASLPLSLSPSEPLPLAKSQVRLYSSHSLVPFPCCNSDVFEARPVASVGISTSPKHRRKCRGNAITGSKRQHVSGSRETERWLKVGLWFFWPFGPFDGSLWPARATCQRYDPRRWGR